MDKKEIEQKINESKDLLVTDEDLKVYREILSTSDEEKEKLMKIFNENITFGEVSLYKIKKERKVEEAISIEFASNIKDELIRFAEGFHCLSCKKNLYEKFENPLIHVYRQHFKGQTTKSCGMINRDYQQKLLDKI